MNAKTELQNCSTCRYYDKSSTSIFGGWCLAGAHLRDSKAVAYGVDQDDWCKDWESRDGSA